MCLNNVYRVLSFVLQPIANLNFQPRRPCAKFVFQSRRTCTIVSVSATPTMCKFVFQLRRPCTNSCFNRVDHVLICVPATPIIILCFSHTDHVILCVSATPTMYYYLYRPRVYCPFFWVTSAFTSYPQESESQYSDETEKTEKRPRRRCGAWWVAPCCCLLTLLATALLLGLVGGLVVLPALGRPFYEIASA